MKNTIEISTSTLLKITAIILGLWLVFLIKEVLVMLFVSIIIVSSLEPLVNKLETKKFPRAASAGVLYFTFFGLISLCFYLAIPILTFEIKQLGENIPGYFQSIDEFILHLNSLIIGSNIQLSTQELINNISNWLTGSISGLFSNSLSFVLGIFKAFVIFALAFYLLVKKEGLGGFISFVLPEKHKTYALGLTKRIQTKMGGWLLGQLTVAFLVFSLEFLVLSLLSVPYALLIAVLGGFFNIIPFVGPFIAFVPTVLVALIVSPWTALLVGILYIVIQQIEGYVFVPLIMNKTVGLDPIVIIVVLMIGLTLWGFWGMLIAIPFATALNVIFKDYQNKKFPSN